VGIHIREEPYDGPVATALVRALLDDLNVRYAAWADEPEHLPANQQGGDDDYLAEVTAAQLSRPTGVFVVAWIDGEPAGCGALRGSPDFPGEGEIKRMYATPVARGRGVGRAVLRHLEEVAVELGYRRLRLETGTAQPEAVALYESSGWQRIESYGRYQGHPASVCLGKELGGP
jgi:GNAT superfamily N-acetyltransferase